MAGPADNRPWVPMVDPSSGIVRTVHPDDVQVALDRGLTVETPREAQVRQYQSEHYNDLGGAAAALGEHALSSATLGLSDVALSQLPGYSEGRQLRDVTHSGAATVGELAGFLAPGLGEVKGLGVIGKAVKVIGAPAEATMAAGRAVARGVERTVAGSAPGAVRGALSRVAGGVSGGSLEGALIGGGQAVSDAAINDKDLTAELLLSHMADGAAVGGALGGSMGAAGAILRGAKKGLTEALAGTRGAEGLAESTALRSFGAQGSDFKRIVKEHGPDAPFRIGRRILTEGGFEGEGSVVRALKHDIGTAVYASQDAANKWRGDLRGVFKELDDAGMHPDASTVLQRVEKDVLAPRRASDWGGDAKIVRAIENDMGPVARKIADADGLHASAANVSDLKVRIAGLRDTLAEELESGSLLSTEEMTRAARGASNELRLEVELMQRQMKKLRVSGASQTLGEVAGALGKADAADLSFAQHALDGLDSVGVRLEEELATRGSPKMTFDQLWKLQQRVGKDVSSWAKNGDPRLSAYQQLYGTLKKIIDEEAQATGLADRYRAANAGMHDWLTVKKIAEERSGSLAGNRTVSLTDTIAGAAGIATGGLGGAATALGLALGNRALRSQAVDRLASTLLNRFSSARSVIEAADSAAQQVGKQSRAMVKASPLPAREVGATSRAALNYEDKQARVREMQGNPNAIVEAVGNQLQGLDSVNPDLSASMVQAGSRTNAALFDALPTDAGFQDLKSLATKNGLSPADEEIRSWLRKEQAARRPLSVVRNVQKGQVSADEVAMMQKASPSLYEVARNEALKHAIGEAARGRIPNEEQRLALSVFTGVPLDNSARPEVVSFYQNRAASKRKQPSNPTMPKSPPRRGKESFAGRRRDMAESEVA